MIEAEEFDSDADVCSRDPIERGYEPIFRPITTGRMNWALREGFYRAAFTIAQVTIDKNFRDDPEGIAALFLFRHYLEPSLKLALYKGRSLKSGNEDASASEKTMRTHSLKGLWDQAKRDSISKIEAAYRAELDIPFLDACISELHKRDPSSLSFRYPENEIEKCEVSFPCLISNMEHVHDTLEKIISWLDVSYDQNQEWQDILNSL